MARFVLAIDQGTTGSTVLVVDEAQHVRARGYCEFPQIYPQPGWVEHDPEAIWRSVQSALAQALQAAQLAPGEIAAIGITNQRETTLCFDQSGQPMHNAIVWQDRRTADICAKLRAEGHQELVQKTTGLVLDPRGGVLKKMLLPFQLGIGGKLGDGLQMMRDRKSVV